MVRRVRKTNNLFYMKRAIANRKAITLMELMLAAAIMSLVFVTGHILYTSGIRMQQRSTERSRVQTEVMNAMENMVKELERGNDIFQPVFLTTKNSNSVQNQVIFSRDDGSVGDSSDDTDIKFELVTSGSASNQIEKLITPSPGGSTSSYITSNAVARITTLEFSRYSGDVNGETNKVYITMTAEDTRSLGVLINMDTHVVLKGMAIN
ncbi:MAG: hypothetical protein AUJ75_02850 [Candidatus Omnitrophica bacterium CG1_02_49_10]|nr:MAG: hypothetical protein AUJ75_02850 [Candidatus Omnitrophica bacterium CG1_02_49_10]